MIKLNGKDRDIILRACNIGTTIIQIGEDKKLRVIAQDKSVTYLDLLEARETATNVNQIVIDSKMAAIMKCMVSEDIYIIKEDGKVHIKDENIKSSFAEMECEYTTPNEEPIGIGIINLNFIKRVLYSAAQSNSTMPILEGVNFEFSDGSVEVVTTDGFRGSRYDIPVEVKQGQLQGSMTIAKTDIQKVLGIFEGQVMICVTEKKVYFMGDGSTLVVSKLSDKYVDYNTIDKSLVANDCMIKVKKADLQNAINICSVIGSNGVKLNIFNDKTATCIGSNNTGVTEVSLKLEDSTGNAEITFNPKYLLEMINNLESEDITLNIGSGNSKIIKAKENNYSSFSLGIAEKKEK